MPHAILWHHGTPEDPMSDPTDPRAFLRKLFDAAIAAVDPVDIVAAHLPPPPIGRTIVIGAGKAAAR
ncbi:MAG: DUF4147 domain-containing protein, partial [Telluria sp.]